MGDEITADYIYYAYQYINTKCFVLCKYFCLGEVVETKMILKESSSLSHYEHTSSPLKFLGNTYL